MQLAKTEGNILVPKLWDLTSTGVPSFAECWEIGVPTEENLHWSLILAYLLLSEEKLTFNYRIKCLGIPNTEIKKMEEIISNFNPFSEDRLSIFESTYMREKLKTFMSNLTKLSKRFKTGKAFSSIPRKLQTASSMLQCCIYVFTQRDDQGIQKWSIKTYQSDNNPEYNNIIILFDRNNAFNLGLFPEQVLPLRQQVFNALFKMIKGSTEAIERLWQMTNNDKHFIKCLLSDSSTSEMLPSIYNNPYVAVKLSEAGFETDPLVFINGHSGFYDAINHVDSKYLKILYKYKIGSKLFNNQTDDPKTNYLTNLRKIGEILRVEMNNSSNNDRILRISRLYHKFNEFQQEVMIKIKNIEDSFAGKPVSDIIQFEKGKNVILGILECYLNFFYFSNGPQIDADDELFDYINCFDYYENLDAFACILFFENVFHIQEYLKYTDTFECLTQSFYILILIRRGITPFKHEVQCVNCTMSREECEFAKNKSKMLPAIYERLYLQHEISKFINEFKGATLFRNEKDKDLIRRSLSSLSVVMDMFRCRRFNHYLGAAAQTIIDENMNDLNKSISVLLIERALQVIGELCPSNNNSSKFCYLLGAYLTQEVEEHFLKIRNSCLSHYYAHSSQFRLAMEKDISRFMIIQKEFQNLMYTRTHLRFNLYLDLQQYLIHRGLKLASSQEIRYCGTASNVHHRSIFRDDCKNIKIMKESLDETGKLIYKTTAKNILNYLNNFLNNKKINVSQSSCANNEIRTETVKDMLKYFLPVFLFIAKNSSALKTKVELCDQCIKLCKSEKLDDETKNILLKFIDDIRFHIGEIFVNISNEPYYECQHIQLFHNAVRNYQYFTPREKRLIKKGLPVGFRKEIEAKQILKACLKGEQIISDDERKTKFKDLHIRKAERNVLRKNFGTNTKEALVALNSARDIEENIFLKKVLTKSEYEAIISNISPACPRKVKKKLLNLVKHKLNFLRNRIQMMKNILINENEQIQRMWNEKSGKCQELARTLMIERYMEKTEIQISLEMILFDCMNSLHKHKGLKDLWTKSNSLFSGLNLRNFISHGNPIIQSFCDILNKKDLPTEFIDKMLEFIEDEKVLETMEKLFVEARVSTAEELEREINRSATDCFSDSRKLIKNCKRWHNYTFLFR
ncbi:uncharacterized protein LOC118185166 isoform X2 [Stegodyphus dumicola]|nr:uncharacterized protein LOC118185166 isoform X2 [Stegodyphus dumicola]XP_035210889.1 uncharacterized protein LOC118185166 isoform X2 [Stegodyphus dumicola]